MILLLAALAFLGVPAGTAAQAEPTWAEVRKRGELICGINGQLPGFSIHNERKKWVGLEIDYCRAIAAAVLGDARKTRFVPLTTANRFDALRNGSIDVLVRNTTASLERTARQERLHPAQHTLFGAHPRMGRPARPVDRADDVRHPGADARRSTPAAATASPRTSPLSPARSSPAAGPPTT